MRFDKGMWHCLSDSLDHSSFFERMVLHRCWAITREVHLTLGKNDLERGRSYVMLTRTTSRQTFAQMANGHAAA